MYSDTQKIVRKESKVPLQKINTKEESKRGRKIAVVTPTYQ